MNVYWLQYAIADVDEYVTVLVDALSMIDAKVQIVANASHLRIDLTSNEQYTLVEYCPEELREDPRWADQVYRMLRVPRMTILTRRDIERYGLLVANPDDTDGFERARAQFLSRATQ